MENLLITTLGWAGAIGLLVAYFLSLAKRMSNTSYLYLGINGLCSVFLIINATYAGAYPFVLINTLWAITSVYHIVSKKRKEAVFNR